MAIFECFTKGTIEIEADTAEEARAAFADLIASQPTADFIFAEEIIEECP